MCSSVAKALFVCGFATQHQKFIYLYFGIILFIAVFISILAIHQFTFNSYFFTYCQMLFGNFSKLAPHYEIVPLCVFYFLAFCVTINLCCGNAEVGYFFSTFKCFYFGCITQLPISCTLFFNAYIVLKFVPLFDFCLQVRFLNLFISINRLTSLPIDNTKMWR